MPTVRCGSVFSDSSYFAGVYQVGELQARPWIVTGTLVSGAMFSRAASWVFQRGVGASRTRA